MELLDIVDEKDNVIGQLPVGEAYRQGKIKRAIGVFCFKDESKKEVLLQLRSREHKHRPNVWSLVTGLVSSGKTYDETVVREFAEEMCHDLHPPDLTFCPVEKFRKDEDDDPNWFVLYETVYSGPFSIQESEVADWKWVDIKRLREEVRTSPGRYTETLRVCLEHYFSSGTAS